MQNIKLYWHPNCSSCKKALKFLKDHRIDVSLIDLREKSPSKKELSTMFKNYSDTPKKLFNTSGQAYRAEGLKDRISDMNQKEMETELTNNGLLVKRPFMLLKSGAGLVGFKEDEWKDLLKMEK